LQDDSGFVRIGKSVVINLRYVKEFTKSEGGRVILTDGVDLELSRRKMEVFIMRVRGIL
jgi:two-component system LytT family response regulator